MRSLTSKYWALVALGLISALAIHNEWATTAELDRLRLLTAQLEIENSDYRAASADARERIGSLILQASELSERSEINSEMLRSIRHLPESTGVPLFISESSSSSFQAFEELKGLLDSLDYRLETIRQGVAYREALVSATPAIWPTDGWISGGYGYREDPFTGERDFHPAVDISTQQGQPVYATATGRVISAKPNGNYGNLVEIDHGFKLSTRYGHLSHFAVAAGDTVQRGDVIGYVGATGRATGYHVHYEVWAADRTLNPMQLLSQSRGVSGN